MLPSQHVVARLLTNMHRVVGAVDTRIEQEDDVNVLRGLNALAMRFDRDVSIARGILLDLKDLDKPFPPRMYMEGGDYQLPRGAWPTARREWTHTVERLRAYDNDLIAFQSSSIYRAERDILTACGFDTYADMLDDTPAYA